MRIGAGGRVALFGVALLAPGVLGAQIVPGAKPPDRNAMRAEFMDEVIQGVRATATKWVKAWRQRDTATVTKLYVDQAFVVTPEGNRVSGKDSVSAYVTHLIEHSGPLQTFLVDVDASDRMAMTLERFVLATRDAEKPDMRGWLLTIYMSDGHTWRIRSQVFRPAAVPGG